MPKIDENSTENILRNYAKFHKSSTLSGRKTKKDLIAKTLQIQFGINQVKDNQIKTHQINLF